MTGKPKRKGGEPIQGAEGETQRGARGREGCGASEQGSGYRLIRLALPPPASPPKSAISASEKNIFVWGPGCAIHFMLLVNSMAATAI